MPRRRSRDAAPVSFFSFQDIILTTAGILILTTLLIVITSVAEPSAAAVSQPQATAESLAEWEQVKADLATLSRQIDSQRQRVRAVGQLTPSNLPQALAQMNDQAGRLRVRLEELSLEIRQAESALAAAAREADAAEQHAGQTLEAAKAAAETLARQATSPRRFLVGEETQRPLLVEVDADQVRVGELADRGDVRLLHSWPGRTSERELAGFARTRNPREEYFVFFVLPGGIERYESLLEACELAGFAVGWDACPADDPIFGRP